MSNNRLLLPDLNTMDEAQLWALNEQLIESYFFDNYTVKEARQLEDAIRRITNMLKKKIEGF